MTRLVIENWKNQTRGKSAPRAHQRKDKARTDHALWGLLQWSSKNLNKCSNATQDIQEQARAAVGAATTSMATGKGRVAWGAKACFGGQAGCCQASRSPVGGGAMKVSAANSGLP